MAALDDVLAKELVILEQMILDLQVKIADAEADPLSDDADLEQDRELLKSAERRVQDNLDKQKRRLKLNERTALVEDKQVVVNEFGYGEPDLTQLEYPHTPPADKVVEPADIPPDPYMEAVQAREDDTFRQAVLGELVDLQRQLNKLVAKLGKKQ